MFQYLCICMHACATLTPLKWLLLILSHKYLALHLQDVPPIHYETFATFSLLNIHCLIKNFDMIFHVKYFFFVLMTEPSNCWWM